MYSISQAAKLIGVSRQSVYNRLDREELQEYICITSKGKMLRIEGLDTLKSLYPVRPDSHQTDNGQSEDNILIDNGQVSDSSQTVENLSTDKYINSIEEQLEYMKTIIIEKDKQLTAYQEQTVSLTRLLENSQVLLKQHQDKIFLLESPKQTKLWWKFWS